MSLAIISENVDGSAWNIKPLDANIPWLIGFTSKEEELEIASKLT